MIPWSLQFAAFPVVISASLKALPFVASGNREHALGGSNSRCAA